MLLQFGALARAKGTLLNYWNVPNSLPGSAGVPPGTMMASRERGRPARTMMAGWERGRPARTKPGTASAISPTWINAGTAPWLSFGLAECGSRRQGGCLRHCTEAQRQPKGQHAGGTPALPGKAVPALPCGSRRSGWLPNRPEAWTCTASSAAAKGTAARASRPHARHRPSPPLGSTGNGAMALLRPGPQGGCLPEAQRQPKGQHAGGTPALPGKAVPADRVAACGIALKLSGSQRDSMRAGRPRSRARPFPPTGWLPAALH